MLPGRQWQNYKADMTQKIHLIAACGTGMGTLACLLKEQGYTVSGSDANVYPPMSDFLRTRKVQLFEGYDLSHLDHDPDLVIIGNAVTRQNVEASAVMERKIPYLSMPEAVNRFIARDRKIILVTGTHGKTTTASIMAHVLYTAGMDPSFMIGGILQNFNSSFRIGAGDYMVIEGDEYDTAFFDKGPKFMHYSPEIAIMTGIEFDHADIFKDIDQIKGVFKDFIVKNQETAHFIAYDSSEHLAAVLAECSAGVETYGRTGRWSFQNMTCCQSKTCFDVTGPDTAFSVETSLVGRHNMINCLACIAAAKKIGIRDQDIIAALCNFSGVKRRQEIRGCRNQVTVMDDFAHHPTAVKETIAAVKPFYADGRVIAVFEPRTNTSMRRFFQTTYPEAFCDADVVCICQPEIKKPIPDNEKFSTTQLVADLENLGIEAYHFENTEALIRFLTPFVKPKDLVLMMSNGGFNNIHTRLLASIG